MRYIIIYLFLSFQLLNSQQIVDFQIDGNVLKVYCTDIDYEIEAYKDNIVKISSFVDKVHSYDSSYTVILKPEVISVEITYDTDFIYYNTSMLTLKISRDYFGIEFIKDVNVIVKHVKNSFFRSGDINGIFFGLKENESIYGLGLKAVDINRRNLKTILYNQNLYGYEHGESWLNSNVPFFTSSENYAIFVDNHAMQYYSADSSQPNTIRYNVNSGNMNYFFISGESYTELLNLYYQLTGFQPLLPRWACGFFLSKISYSSQNNCMKIVNTMIDGGYPLDALVFDYSWFGYADSMGNITWNKNEYPNPTKLISDLKQKGIKTILISEPYIAQSSANYNDALQKNLLVRDEYGQTPTVNILDADQTLLDIFNERTKEWVWNKYKNRIEEGVDGWWIDLIEPEFHGIRWVHQIGKGISNHNIYSLVWAENLYKNYQIFYPDKRPFLMYRAGWAGSQRYGSILLCGDEARSWKGLKGQIPGMLGMQMSGLAMFTTDIGGFASSWDVNPELYIRWFQFGAFSPIMRLHMGGTNQTEPFHYDTKTQDIVREYIKLRYKLLPYNYTLFWENSEAGIPPARPMNFYSNDLKFRNINDQYFWGKEFLVAHVVEANKKSRDVILPKGNWIDYRSKKVYSGDTTINASSPLEYIPLFVKAGSFIPTINEIQNTEEYTGDTLIIEYYPDSEYPISDFTMYDDDGKSPGSNKKGEYQLINFKGIASSDSLIIWQSATGSFSEMPTSRQMFYKIYNFHSENCIVHVNQKKLSQAKSYNEYLNSNEYFIYDKVNNLLELNFKFAHTDTEIIITNVTNGIDDSGEHTTFHIYPVPGKDELNIEINNIKNGNYKFVLFNIQGKQVSEEMEISANDNRINDKLKLNQFAGVLANGMYYLRITGNNFDKSIKLNIEN